MVLKDDSFSSIVLAIKQGRVIFDNIRKFVIFLLSCNLSELLIIATASILNLHFQLFPLQILFINLVADVLPALALGVTDAGPHIMERKLYASQVAIIDKKRWTAIFSYSIIITVTSIGAVGLDRRYCRSLCFPILHSVGKTPALGNLANNSQWNIRSSFILFCI
jgi:Ca2+-transporting ATPase